MMQSFAMMAIITVLWAFLTYSLAFDSGTSLHRRTCTTFFCTESALTPDAAYVHPFRRRPS